MYLGETTSRTDLRCLLKLFRINLEWKMKNQNCCFHFQSKPRKLRSFRKRKSSWNVTKWRRFGFIWCSGVSLLSRCSRRRTQGSQAGPFGFGGSCRNWAYRSTGPEEGDPLWICLWCVKMGQTQGLGLVVLGQ